MLRRLTRTIPPHPTGCGMGGDAASRACAFQCALDNRNDVTESLFTCVLDKGCMPEMLGGGVIK